MGNGQRTGKVELHGRTDKPWRTSFCNGAIGRPGPKLAVGIDSGICLSILDEILACPGPLSPLPLSQSYHKTQIADALMPPNSRCAQQTAVGPAQGPRFCP